MTISPASVVIVDKLLYLLRNRSANQSSLRLHWFQHSGSGDSGAARDHSQEIRRLRGRRYQRSEKNQLFSSSSHHRAPIQPAISIASKQLRLVSCHMSPYGSLKKRRSMGAPFTSSIVLLIYINLRTHLEYQIGFDTVNQMYRRISLVG